MPSMSCYKGLRAFLLAVLIAMAWSDGIEQECVGREFDLIFVVDGSGSIDNANWVTQLDFIDDVAQGLDVSSSAAHVGFVQYSGYAQEEISLTSNRNAFRTSLCGTTLIGTCQHCDSTLTNANTCPVGQIGGTTYANHGLDAAAAEFTQNGRAGAAQIVVFTSDGQFSDESAAYTAATNLKNSGVTIISVGVSSGVSTTQMTTVATRADLYNHVSSFANLDALVSTLAGEVCTAVSTTPTRTPSPSPSTSPSPTMTPSSSPTTTPSSSVTATPSVTASSSPSSSTSTTPSVTASRSPSTSFSTTGTVSSSSSGTQSHTQAVTRSTSTTAMATPSVMPSASTTVAASASWSVSTSSTGLASITPLGSQSLSSVASAAVVADRQASPDSGAGCAGNAPSARPMMNGMALIKATEKRMLSRVGDGATTCTSLDHSRNINTMRSQMDQMRPELTQCAANGEAQNETMLKMNATILQLQHKIEQLEHNNVAQDATIIKMQQDKETQDATVANQDITILALEQKNAEQDETITDLAALVANLSQTLREFMQSASPSRSASLSASWSTSASATPSPSVSATVSANVSSSPVGQTCLESRDCGLSYSIQNFDSPHICAGTCTQVECCHFTGGYNNYQGRGLSGSWCSIWWGCISNPGGCYAFSCDYTTGDCWERLSCDSRIGCRHLSPYDSECIQRGYSMTSRRDD